jgi:hypothetical protein
MTFPIDPKAPAAAQPRLGADLFITPELLVELMRLPKGTRIRGARYDAASATVILVVSHPDVHASRITPTYYREWSDCRVTFVDWGQERVGDVAQVETVDDGRR